MSVEQRKEVLFQQLELCSLKGWLDKKQVTARVLLAEYYDIFSFEPGVLGCTDLVRHKIRVIDDKPFKERFWRIPPPMVDEVCAHVKEMLEVGVTGGSRLSQIFWEHENQSGLLVIWLIYIKLYRKKETKFWEKNPG